MMTGSCGGGECDNCLLPQEPMPIKRLGPRTGVSRFNSHNAPKDPVVPATGSPVDSREQRRQRRMSSGVLVAAAYLYRLGTATVPAELLKCPGRGLRACVSVLPCP